MGGRETGSPPDFSEPSYFRGIPRSRSCSTLSPPLNVSRDWAGSGKTIQVGNVTRNASTKYLNCCQGQRGGNPKLKRISEYFK